MKLKTGTFYNLSGALFNGEEMGEFVTQVRLIRIDPDGSLWAEDKEGNEFEVLEEDLSAYR